MLNGLTVIAFVSALVLSYALFTQPKPLYRGTGFDDILGSEKDVLAVPVFTSAQVPLVPVRTQNGVYNWEVEGL